MDSVETKPLISEKLFKPIMLLWTMILPQAVLAIINISSWNLIQGEMSQEQRRLSFQVFAFEIIIFIAAIVIAATLRLLKRKLNLVVCLILFLIHIAYLWVITSCLSELLPDSVTLWILPPDEVMYYQFILMMPVIFYTGLRISCFKIPTTKTRDVSITVAVLLMVPLCSYLFTTVFYRIFWDWNIPGVILTCLFIGATVITMMAFLRILAWIYLSVNKSKASQTVLLVAVGLAGPLGGLALNRAIPFPCDFQSVFVYVLAVVNGLVLLVNFEHGTKREAFVWFLKCMMYPFSLYFFLVFLPFLPLALLAIIAMGSGFLILTPTALFIIHSRMIVDEGKRAAGTLGWKLTLLLFAAGFAVIPAIISARALSDRHSLTEAIDAVYSPDYTKSSVEIKPESVRRSLLKLRDMKDGIFLPFISTFYNKVVFNGMVLPDHKMDEMYLMFFGKELPRKESNERFSFSGRTDFRNRTVVMPDRNVIVSDVKIDRQQEGDFVRANIQLTLTNKGQDQSEFVTEIALEEGVMVSGYWLKVGDEKKAGNIFEKKAAMWIYHMIRDVTRRDPGLLVYKTEQLLKLSVYPFANKQERLTGIELLYPAGMSPTVRIGYDRLKIEPDSSSEQTKIILANTGKESLTAIIPNQSLSTLPLTQRKPYLHFIVDCSVDAQRVFGTFGRIMSEIANKYGHANMCRITLANYESTDLTDELMRKEDIDNIMHTAAPESADFKGAFCYSKIIKQKLLELNPGSAKNPNNEYMVPIFVVVTAQSSQTVTIGEMSSFGRITPDIKNYYIASPDGNFLVNSFNGEEGGFSMKIEVPKPTVLFKYGNTVEACVLDSGWGFADFQNDDGNMLEVYDSGSKSFSPVRNVKTLDNDTTYAKGLAVWNKFRETVYSPNRITKELPAIVNMSKQCGIMVPSTSYIVLENTAQLEMLKRKEKQGLSANQALEFDEFMESPAPPIMILVPLAMVLMLKLKRRKSSIG